ncbi:HPr(Ser) kinase/phosphatase [bacterium]|nr:HPr(Ser) kinase/phosphatase [bacterium]
MNTPLTEAQKQIGTAIEHITVRELVDDSRERFELSVLAGEEGLERKIASKEVHRPGLALAGFLDLFTFDRVQILGNTEIKYLTHLGEKQCHKSVVQVMNHELPCIILTHGNDPPAELVDIANKKRIPILTTDRSSTDVIHLLSDYLDDRFAPYITVHGSLVDVYGTGMLFTGRSGIGKSEIALDLVERGHRLVSDDTVRIEKKTEGILMGSSPEVTRHFIEVRGVGMIDVRRMFGVRGVRMQKRVEVEVRLQEWDDNFEWERIGLDQESTRYLGADIPLIRLPIFPGKNITMIAEVIALNVHVKVYGFNAAEELNKRLLDEIDKQKVKGYLIRDYE